MDDGDKSSEKEIAQGEGDDDDLDAGQDSQFAGEKEEQYGGGSTAQRQGEHNLSDKSEKCIIMKSSTFIG